MKIIITSALALVLALSLAACERKGEINISGFVDGSEKPVQSTTTVQSTAQIPEISSTTPDNMHGSSNELVGIWEYWTDGSITMSYDFYDDNRIKVFSAFMGDSEGTYKVQGNVLTITIDGDDEAVTFTVNGDTLAIDNGDGGIWEMTKAGTTQKPTDVNDKPVDNGVDGLTLAAVKKAVQDMGYEVSDEYSAGFSPPANPKNGFNAVFTDGGEFYLAFMEFENEAEAKAYKEYADKPNDLFPEEYIVYGRFVGETVSGFNAEADAAIRAFVENVFAAAN